jgi:hypothetical protein
MNSEIKLNNTKRRLDMLKCEMGSISGVDIIDGKVVLSFENGMNLTLSDSEVDYQSEAYIESCEGYNYEFEGSWGTIKCDMQGNVISIDGDEEIDGERNYLFDIAKFDIEEHKNFCESVGITHGEADDILNIGFWKKNGEYSEADKDWRKRMFNNPIMKDEIEKVFINLITKLGMDLPENWEDIVQFIYEDIMDCADEGKWNNDDVVIGFRRWIEEQ